MTLAHWAAALKQHWGIDAELSRLDGEYDLNFLVNGRDGQGYILKAMPIWLRSEFWVTPEISCPSIRMRPFSPS